MRSRKLASCLLVAIALGENPQNGYNTPHVKEPRQLSSSEEAELLFVIVTSSMACTQTSLVFVRFLTLFFL